MNVLLLTDSYTIGTGIMPSELNGGSIVSIPLKCQEHYSVGYILRDDRRISSLVEKFIQMLSEFTGSMQQHGRKGE